MKEVEEWLRKWSNRYKCGVVMIVCMLLGVFGFLKFLTLALNYIESVFWLAVFFLVLISAFVVLFILSLVSVFGLAQNSKYIKRECPNCHTRIKKVMEYRWDGRDSEGKDIWVRVKDETF